MSNEKTIEEYKNALISVIDENKELKGQLDYADKEMDRMASVIENKNEVIFNLCELITDMTN